MRPIRSKSNEGRIEVFGAFSNRNRNQAESLAQEELTALEQLTAHSASKMPELKNAMEELEQFKSGL